MFGPPEQVERKLCAAFLELSWGLLPVRVGFDHPANLTVAGIVVEEGPPAQLLDDPTQDRTRRFLRMVGHKEHIAAARPMWSQSTAKTRSRSAQIGGVPMLQRRSAMWISSARDA